MCNRDRHATLTLAIGLTLLLAVPGPGLADDPLFPGPQYLTAGAGGGDRNDGIVGDLNGDGHLDVVAANSDSATISVMLNDGTGRLALTGVYDAGYGKPIVADDLDNDGDLDLAFNSGGDWPISTISVLLGNGDGTFSPGSSTTAGWYPEDIAARDLDGDGDSDLVTANQDINALSVLLNNGDATFSVASIDVQGPCCLVIAELNGDGDLDLAVGGSYGEAPAIWLLPGHGDGTFAAATLLDVPGYPWDITAEDVDGDGDKDLIAVVVQPYGPGDIAVLRNYGNGTFAPYESYLVGYAGALATGDLNGDGNPDVVTRAGCETAVLLGLGNGAFAPAEAYYDFSGVGSVLRSVVGLGDLDGDADLDVIVPGPLVTVLLGNGDGTLVSGSMVDVGAWGVVSGDLDGDGDVDLATTGVYVLLNEGGGTYASPVGYPAGAPGSKAITSADLDGDGDLDLATANRGDGYYTNATVSVFFNHGDGTFAVLPPIRAPRYACGIAAGDLNGDSFPDLAVTSLSAGGAVSILFGDGQGTFVLWFSFHVGNGSRDVAMADLDGDGDRDLVVGGNDIKVLEGLGDGTFIYPPTTYPDGRNPVALEDLNHDGDLDLAAANDTQDGLVVFLGNGDGTFGAPSDFWTGLEPLDLAIGDVDGDGHPDLVVGQVFNLFGAHDFGVLLGQGDGTFGAPLYFGGGASGVTIDDLDGDGALDLASSRVAVLLNQSLTIPGDLDGDGCVGHSDLAILLADWGCGGGDCPGDVDGDGDTDHSDLAILLAHWGEGCP